METDLVDELQRQINILLSENVVQIKNNNELEKRTNEVTEENSCKICFEEVIFQIEILPNQIICFRSSAKSLRCPASDAVGISYVIHVPKKLFETSAAVINVEQV